jgi:hypothetical protein
MNRIKYRDLEFRCSYNGANYRLTVEHNTLHNRDTDDNFLRSASFRFDTWATMHLSLMSFCFLIYGETPKFSLRDTRDFIVHVEDTDYPYSVE